MQKLGKYAYKEDDYDMCIKALNKSKDTILTHLDSNHLSLLNIYELLSKVYWQKKDKDKAKIFNDQAIYIKKKNKSLTTDTNVIFATLKDRGDSER